MARTGQMWTGHIWPQGVPGNEILPSQKAESWKDLVSGLDEYYIQHVYLTVEILVQYLY